MKELPIESGFWLGVFVKSPQDSGLLRSQESNVTFRYERKDMFLEGPSSMPFKLCGTPTADVSANNCGIRTIARTHKNLARHSIEYLYHQINYCLLH
jgi:hypothetical protein